MGQGQIPDGLLGGEVAQQPVAMNHRTCYLGLNSNVIYFSHIQAT